MSSWINVADVMIWLGADVDAMTAGVVADAATAAVKGYIERDVALQTNIVETYDSNGTDYLLLNSWPIRTIRSVGILGMGSVLPAVPGYSGWRLDRVVPRKLVFAGYGKIPRGVQNITVAYDAGYDLSQPVGSATGMPGDLYLALKLTANAIYNAQAADTNLMSEATAGVFSGAFQPGGVGSVPVGAQTLLMRGNHRRATP